VSGNGPHAPTFLVQYSNSLPIRNGLWPPKRLPSLPCSVQAHRDSFPDDVPFEFCHGSRCRKDHLPVNFMKRGEKLVVNDYKSEGDVLMTAALSPCLVQAGNAERCGFTNYTESRIFRN
jgi:hypothetical protein